MAPGTRLRQCPWCHSRVTVAADRLGMGIWCPMCHRIFVPEPDGSGPSGTQGTSHPTWPFPTPGEERPTVALEPILLDGEPAAADRRSTWLALDRLRLVGGFWIRLALEWVYTLRSRGRGKSEGQLPQDTGVWDRDLDG
jgi:hypothetical protein